MSLSVRVVDLESPSEFHGRKAELRAYRNFLQKNEPLIVVQGGQDMVRLH